MRDFEGKTAFVTGAASGIGLALARACGDQGMRVMLSDIDRPALDIAVSSLRDSGVDAAGVVCDVASEKSLREAADATIRQFDKVHLLINNAGVLVLGGAGETTLETWRRAMDVNVMSVVYGVEIFLPLMLAHGEGGHILNTASVGGHVGFAGVLAYSTTKHAVVGYSESLFGQLKEQDIGVSVLCPGFTSTRIAETGLFEDEKQGGSSDDMGFGAAGSAFSLARASWACSRLEA